MRTAIGIGLVLLAAYLLFWPTGLNPGRWNPPPLPEASGVWEANARLKGIERLAADSGAGPEALWLDPDGRVTTGLLDGRLIEWRESTGWREIANTGGRPLGIERAADGALIVADARRGLLRVSPEGEVSVLADEVAGVPVLFADDLTITRDQRVYYTDASTRFGVDRVRQDFFEHRPNGRILAYDLRSGRSWQVTDGLYFPNGIALGPDETHVVVTETAKYRVLRFAITETGLGAQEVLADNLPGLPDNITFNGRDRYWVAFYGPRSAALDSLLPRPWLRKVAARLPEVLQPHPAPVAWVAGLALDGRIMDNLRYDAAQAYAPITSAREHAGHLYFGSLSAAGFGRIAWPNGDAK